MSHRINRFPIRGFLSPFCSWQLIYWSRATGYAINNVIQYNQVHGNHLTRKCSTAGWWETLITMS